MSKKILSVTCYPLRLPFDHGGPPPKFAGRSRVRRPVDPQARTNPNDESWAIVDTRQHFQSLSDAAYPWLDPDRLETLEGDLSPIRRDYLPADYHRDGDVLLALSPPVGFDTAVTVLVGLGFPAKIQTVKEAYALLEDWPTSRRDTAHAVALRACRAALSGDIEAETDRGMFVAFARKHDLLAPEPQGIVAARREASARPTAWR